MKTKIFLGIVAVGLLIMTEIFILRIQAPSSKQFEKAGYNFIPCTATNFLLNKVDTTRQIAPLFENLGNLAFEISTKNAVAQAFFNQGLRLCLCL